MDGNLSTNSSSADSTRVEVFLRSVIEAASGLTYPLSSSTPSPTSDRDSTKNHEIIENTFGEIGQFPFDNNKPKSPNSLKPRRTKKELHRANLLRRKQSSLKPLSPEDLGSVLNSSPVTLSLGPTNDSAEFLSPVSPRADLLDNHISAFHLRKPISKYLHPDKISGGNRERDYLNNDEVNVVTLDKGPNYNPDSIMDNLADSLPSLTSYQDKRVIVAEPLATKNLQVKIDEGRQGRLDNRHSCVRHIHHHSHHHHYYYDRHCGHSNQLQQQVHDQNYRSIYLKNEQDKIKKSRSDDDEPSGGNDDQQYLHNEIEENDEKGYFEQPIVSPLPHDLHDISFYRKFSATSPFRSKSSMQWPPSEFNGLNFNSKWMKQKSRSTPIKLDVISAMGEPKLLQIPMIHYGCICNGCPYCCNELSCACSCDDCCCARQSNFNDSTDSLIIDNEGSTESQQNHTGSRKKSLCETSSLKTSIDRSHSMDSLASRMKENPFNDIEITEEALNDPEAFIDAHLLSHLEYSESDDGEEDNNDNRVEGSEHADMRRSSVGRKESQVHFLTINRPDTDHGTQPGAYSDIGGSDENIEKNKGSSVRKSSDYMSERSVTRSTSSIVIVRKTPTRSSILEGGVRRSNGKRSRSVLRVANGGIRSSPISPMTTLSIGSPDNEKLGNTGGKQQEENRSPASNAMMTVTVDSMSLFLDAVHIQMNQE